jgi:quercetin dioxygenase-like cupin family protein
MAATRPTFLVVVLALALRASAAAAPEASRQVRGFTAQEIPWFTPAYYTDGRQRARLLGDSSQGGAWIDRVKIPAGSKVLAHTHPSDEVVTVIEGTWYLGVGETFDESKLEPYPRGSFVVIPAGLPHFLATREGPVIVQASGEGAFRTQPLER